MWLILGPTFGRRDVTARRSGSTDSDVIGVPSCEVRYRCETLPVTHQRSVPAGTGVGVAFMWGALGQTGESIHVSSAVVMAMVRLLYRYLSSYI